MLSKIKNKYNKYRKKIFQNQNWICSALVVFILWDSAFSYDFLAILTWFFSRDWKSLSQLSIINLKDLLLSFQNLTDTGENIQKWTRVFSTRCWVILVAQTRTKKEKKIVCPLLDVFACGQVSSPRLYRLTIIVTQTFLIIDPWIRILCPWIFTYVRETILF